MHSTSPRRTIAFIGRHAAFHPNTRTAHHAVLARTHSIEFHMSRPANSGLRPANSRKWKMRRPASVAPPSQHYAD